jgi:hypothetical protein
MAARLPCPSGPVLRCVFLAASFSSTASMRCSGMWNDLRSGSRSVSSSPCGYSGARTTGGPGVSPTSSPMSPSHPLMRAATYSRLGVAGLVSAQHSPDRLAWGGAA